MMFGYRKTKNKAKGLMFDESYDLPMQTAPEDKFFAPNKIDHRDLCIHTDNQTNTPFCTAYATAGYIEIKHWQKKHFPKQYPAVDIYAETKKIDGYNGDGSWVKFAIAATKNMGLINGQAKYVPPTIRDLKFAILEYGACIASFDITNEWNIVRKKTGAIVNYGFNSRHIGGHAVLICGYSQKGVYIQNSWGSKWGVWGFGLLSWGQFSRQFKNGVVIEDIEVL
jgi:hypothetical protein